MTEEFDHEPASTGPIPDALPSPAVTTLNNGVRVVTQETFQQATSLGIFIGAGSRNETGRNMGVTNLLEKMAFQSSEEFSKARIMYEIEMLGARDNIFANRSRETMIYGADVLRDGAEDMMTILLNCIFHPKYDAAEVEEQKAIIQDVELKNLEQDPTTQAFEAFHRAAYGDNTLGLPMFAGPSTLNYLSSEELFAFKADYFTGNNIVISGASVDHDKLVSYAEQHLSGLEAGSHAEAQVAEYVGGERMVPGFTDESHIAIGFQGVSYNDPDMIYYHALHMMLGGGLSFSAGGPGKGLYSRLYQNVLNRNHWVQSATAFNVQYEDTGFFGIIGSARKEEMGYMQQVLCEQLAGMVTVKADAEELGRVKNMLKSYMLMNFERRDIVMEDLGRQILATNKYVSSSTLCDQVDSITADDLQRVAKKMLSTPVTISGHGDLSLVSRSDISTYFGSA